MPVTEILEPADPALLDAALTRLTEFDWLIFTSPNGVESVKRRFDSLGLSFDRFPHLKIAVVGPATAEALSELGRTPNAMPKKFVAEKIAEAMGELSNTRILLARGDLATGDLPEALAERGATLVDVTAYRIVRTNEKPEMEGEPMPDAITVMSGESARAIIDQLRECGLGEWLRQVPIACIGPVTAASVENEKLHPAAIAQEHTVDGLVKTLEELFSRGAPSA
jgi:uroporphyrinogen III methyltransferase/synthase